MALEFVRIYRELLDLKGLKISQAPEFIKMETGYEITVQQAYEFLDEKRESCPNACVAAIWGQAFKVSLPARYFGAGSYKKGGGK
jgi:hypothetical protein